MTDLVRISPVDVIYFRGNRLFADAGHSGSSMPPCPSVIAGALRSRMLVDRKIELRDFAAGRITDEQVRAVIGEGPLSPGSFRVSWVGVVDETGASARLLFPLPADLLVEADGPRLHALGTLPAALGSGVRAGSCLPEVATLDCARPFKPAGGHWIDAPGLRAHLQGRLPESSSLVAASQLWGQDARVGLALEAGSRTAREGFLYSGEAMAMRRDRGGVSFLTAVSGAGGLLPEGGSLRLGGDSRAAAVTRWTAGPIDGPWAVRPVGARFRMVLSTPGLFPGGWLPAGVEPGTLVLQHRGFTARLVAAAVPRHEVVSGWDLATDRPKPAQRVAPAGSVYWFEWVSGSRPGESAAAFFEELAAEGLWPLMKPALESGSPSEQALWRARRAEGFNNVWFGECMSDRNCAAAPMRTA